MEPGHIIRWSFAGKPFHHCGIVPDKGDSVAQHYLKWGQGSFLQPLVKHLSGLVKTAHDHECLARIGVVLSRRHRGMVNCPIELLQGLFRSALLRVGNPQQVVSDHTAWIRLLVQNKYSSFPFQIARYRRMIKGSSLKILFLRETAIL